ncbi:hypothetical protein MAR_006527 [Mya arenaria]|uniref:Uncharacterized protein n=1 Tax=Mya arenaria TaxID=6604 RepID=A0ABY7DBS8_MYAAR|nr:hypothetical protein MAR_006527 [Mya arenaria]
MPVNTTLRFVDDNNNIVDRRITKIMALPTYGHSSLSGYDIVVGELDSDVPFSISYAQVMPRAVTTIELPNEDRVPVFHTDFEEKALVADFWYESGNTAHLVPPASWHIRRPFYKTKIDEDHGNPVFFVVGDELVLLFMFTYGGAGHGTSISAHYDDINDIIRGWGSSYRLTEVDLSQFLGDHESVPNIIG